MPDAKFKRRLGFYRVGFYVLLALMVWTLYANYDYWVFKMLISQNYIMTDALDELYADAIGEYNVKGYYRDFDRVVMAALTQQIRAVNQDRYTYLYTPQGYQRSRETEKADAAAVHHIALTDDTVYLYLPNISKGTRQYVYAHKEDMANYPILILDLRGNYGGMLRDCYKIADLFVEKGSVLGYEQTRSAFFNLQKKSKGDPFFDFEQIIILQDRATASSAESLIAALAAHVPQATRLGETTFGKGVGQVTLPLTDGYAVRATVMLTQAPDGQTVHRVGIAPDVQADEAEDWVLRALDMLGE